jgi:hypothetical protein
MANYWGLRSLLLKDEDDVGKVRRSHVKLPNASFAYGISPKRDRLGAREGKIKSR